MSRRVAVLIAIAAVGAALASEYIRQVWTQPLWIPLSDLGIGGLLVGCGLVASVARPHQPAGPRIVLAGFLWFAAGPRMWFSDVGRTDDFLQLDALSFTVVGWSDVVLMLTALAFPSRWPIRRSERAFFLALVAVYGLHSLVRLVSRGPDLIGQRLAGDDVIFPLLAWTDLARTILLVGAAGFLIRRWWVSSPPSRRVLGPVLAAGVATGVASAYRILYPLAQLGYVDSIPEELAVPIAWVTNAIRVLVPIGMLVGILRQRAGRSAVADAIASIGDAPSSHALEQALRRALGDPSLRVLAWDARRKTYVDAAGGRVDLPSPGGAVVATLVDGETQPLAAVIHDRALAEDPRIVAAGAALTRLVLDNERLGRELHRQLEEVRASRTRIVAAEDAQRVRIERDLHDGVQQRLLALALALRRAAEKSGGDSDSAAALAFGADEALGVVDDVRDLAQGIHPALLTEAGLPAALRALANRSPVPVELDVAIDEDVSQSAAAAAYFVASEALANVVKHAGASNVRLVAANIDGSIRVSVEDDGRGGANPNGDGFRGLDDRVAAVGGALAVTARAGGGTTVSVTIPAR